MSWVLGNASDRPAGRQTAEQWYESSRTRHASYRDGPVPSSHRLDASGTKGDTWDKGKQIPSMFYVYVNFPISTLAAA
jgi:hypothetical protein